MNGYLWIAAMLCGLFVWDLYAEIRHIYRGRARRDRRRTTRCN